MNNQNRTQTDFFLPSSSPTELPLSASHFDSYSDEELDSQFSQNPRQESSEIDSDTVDSDPYHSGFDYFSTSQPEPLASYRFGSNDQMVPDRRAPDYLVVLANGSQCQTTPSVVKRKSNICLSRENIMKHWTSGDDSELMSLADQYKNDWKKISRRITSNRKKKVTPNFLKNRYKEIAGDHIKKGVKFTHEEDLEIARLFEIHGTSWTLIAHQFKDRTPVMIKNRYYSHIRRKGLLQDLVSEAHVKNRNSEEPQDTEEYHRFDESSAPTPQFQEVENLDDSMINHSDSDDIEGTCNEFAYFIREYQCQPSNRYSSFISDDIALCNLQNIGFENELKVRVTEIKFSENNFQ